MKKRQFKQAGHLLAGVLILVHGIAAFRQRDFEAAVVYLVIAILVLAIAVSHRYMNQRFRRVDVAFFLLEAATLIFSAWEYRAEKGYILSYLMFAVGIGYAIWACLTLIFEDSHGRRRFSPERHRKHMRSTPMDEE
jgi:uncharacterized membrane protein HdeD (DUF308 family)